MEKVDLGMPLRAEVRDFRLKDPSINKLDRAVSARIDVSVENTVWFSTRNSLWMSLTGGFNNLLRDTGDK